ncbi:hypothetical protein OG216_00420 [Streptomycetaceae bacterium NBC_01309]
MDATEPGYDGHISVPVLWDQAAGRIVSNDCAVLPVDLATRFMQWAATPQDLYPEQWRAQIDLLDRDVTAISATGGPHSAHALDALEDFLGGRGHVVGDRLTLADVGLWVKLSDTRPSSDPL